MVRFFRHSSSSTCISCRCCLTNARSIVNKIPELHLLLYFDNYEVLLVTETWLHSGVLSSLLDPHSMYHVLRKDRADLCHNRGGGVAAFVKRGYCCNEIYVEEEFTDLELLCFDLVLGKCKVRFFVIYRPPYQDNIAVNYVAMLIRCMKRYAIADEHSTSIFVGDFNCPKMDWKHLSSPSDHVSKSLLDWAIASGCCQYVTFPTRGENILDLVFANDDQIISSVYAQSPLGNSDHCIIDFSLVIATGVSEQCNTNVQTDSRYNWFKADFETISQCISEVDWYTFVCCNPSALTCWSAFVDFLWAVIDTCVPKYGNCNIRNGKRYPKEIRKLIVKKRNIWRKHKLNPTDLEIRWQYRSCVSELRIRCRDLDRQHEERVVNSKNLGEFYKYVNNRTKYRTPIGALINGDGVVVTSDPVKANMLNDFYATVGVVDDGKILSCTDMELSSVLDTVVFTKADIIRAISKLKPNLSCGPDNLPPLLFKKVKHCLAWPLSVLYNQLFSVAVVPIEWKQAIITPVFKKGTTGDVSNYRPVSLTSVACKIMERVIAQSIYSHLTSNNLLSPAQHGFVKRRSTCTNLLESVNDWTLIVQNKNAVAIAYIDFSRAFDSVSHTKLLARLYSYGIRGNVLKWLQNFLEARTHQTRVGHCLSTMANLLSGVVQGSGIGPVLFIIYIDELARLLESQGIVVKLFADDVKVYMEIVNATSAVMLQGALDVIVEWASVWQLQLSVNKCNVLTLGHVSLEVDYLVHSTVLPQVTMNRDLGIMIAQDLSPSIHISGITVRAHQRANCILRCFVSRDRNLLLRAFLVYVRPIVEHCSVVWSPSLKKDIELIEKVQRRFTKRLPGLKHMPYKERLHFLDLPSLELRRLHSDLIYCYKIVFGVVNLRCADFFEFSSVTTNRGHEYKLYKPRCTSSIRSRYFSERIVNVWNFLPSSVNFGTLHAFKTSIQSVDFSSFLKCNVD